MKKQEAVMFTEADNTLHEMIHKIDESLKTNLSEDNKIKARQINSLLEKAHGLIHDLDYGI